MTSLRGAFLRAGRPRTPIAGAAVGIARSGTDVVRWTTTGIHGDFEFLLPYFGPWTLRTRVQGVLLLTPLGRITRDTLIDYVVTAGAALAFRPGTSRRRFVA
mgnify:CR=1 FL=1